MAMNAYDVPRAKDTFGIHRAKPTGHCQILHLHLHTAFVERVCSCVLCERCEKAWRKQKDVHL
jgi:hypothetical protein